jgi:uncharacterized protein (TIGR02466 family)
MAVKMDVNNLEVNHFFSTPVFIMNDGGHSSHYDAMLKEMYAWRDEDTEEVVRSNQGGWHSPSTIFKTTRPELRRICDVMIRCFQTATLKVAPNFKTDGFDMTGEGWVNINPISTFNVPHDHPGYTWSGVYYASLPTRKDSSSRSGALELLDPRTNVSAFATDISKQSAYFSPKRTLSPTNGMIIIFPSYLRHWVYPNEEDEDRITLAFNFKYKPKNETVIATESKTESGAKEKKTSRKSQKKK